MTFRHLAKFSTAFSGLILISAAPAAHAQATAETPVLSPARQAASQITPPLRPNTVLERTQRGLVSTQPVLADAAAAIPVDTSAARVSALPSAGSVISAPHQSFTRVTTNFAPAVTAPAAVPFDATRAAIPADATPPAETEDEKANRLLLSKLEADLDATSERLDRAKDQLSDGQRALNDFTSELQSAMAAAGADARGLNPFVRVAQRYKGTPYVWGGVSARGFDCSGFIIRVMQDLGYRSLPHSAAEQFRYGQPVAQQLLKPGDLVFFANTYKPGISHVGIYLGNRRFIHAANSHVGTIVSSLDMPKWQEKYAGGRRLVPVRASRRS